MWPKSLESDGIRFSAPDQILVFYMNQYVSILRRSLESLKFLDNPHALLPIGYDWYIQRRMLSRAAYGAYRELSDAGMKEQADEILSELQNRKA